MQRNLTKSLAITLDANYNKFMKTAIDAVGNRDRRDPMTTTMTKDLAAAQANWSNGRYRAKARSERSYREYGYVLEDFLPNVLVEVEIEGFAPIVFNYAGSDRYGAHSVAVADENKNFLDQIGETAFPDDATGIEAWFDGIVDVALTAFEQYVDAAQIAERQELRRIESTQVPECVDLTTIEDRREYLIQFSHSAEGVEFEVKKRVEIADHSIVMPYQHEKAAWAAWLSAVSNLRGQPETAICATAGLKVISGSQAAAIAEMFDRFVDT